MKGRFNLTFANETAHSALSIDSSDLLDREKCEIYLDGLAAQIGSPSRRVTASMLAKRYAYLVIVPVLYAMSVYNKGLQLTLDQCRLAAPDDNEYKASNSKFPNLRIRELRVTEPEADKREEWRNQVVSELFGNHITPLFRSLSVFGRVPMPILWENAVVRIVPLYEDGLEDEDDPAVWQRYKDDFTFISQTAQASLFGERRNPLTKFIIAAHEGVANEPAPYMRQTCCFYYEMSPEYCRACPKSPCPV